MMSALPPNCDRKSGHPNKAMLRFTPESGHVQCTSSCLLWANSGHCLSSIAMSACPPGWVNSIRQPRALAVVQSRPHIASMATTFPPAYELTTRPCTIHAGRYRWVITANGKPVSTSGDSFETPELARMDGLIAFERLIHSSRINE
jgi:hypothetical protein